jgi:hypothetical protein
MESLRRSACRALALPLFEEAALLDLALNLVLLECSLSLEIQPALHLAIAARLGRLTLLILDRPVDNLITGHATEKRTADDGCRPPAAAADRRAKGATGRGAANRAQPRSSCAATGFTSCNGEGERYDQSLRGHRHVSILLRVASY